MELVGYLAAALILPLVPAFALYKTLPSRASVKGPFQGLTINLSGAFAGYFLLFVVAAFLVREHLTHGYQMRDVQIWKVVGQVKSPERYFDIAAQDIVRLEPRPIKVFEDGTFELSIVVHRSTRGVDELDFPRVLFGGPAHRKETRVLRPADDMAFDMNRREIEFKQAIVLKPLDADRSGTTPRPEREPPLR